MNVAELRADFPALQQEVHGRPLVYLDNAATTHKPKAVLDALDRFHRVDNSNVHRGVHTLSQRATDSYEGARAKIAQFLGAETDEIVFVRGATEGINLIANAFLRPRLREGDEVLITAMEHHANIVPWHFLRERQGVRLVWVDPDADGSIPADKVLAAVTERTKLIAVTQCSNVLGSIVDVKAIKAGAGDVPVLVDGSQGAVHMPVDVADLGVDCGSVHGGGFHSLCCAAAENGRTARMMVAAKRLVAVLVKRSAQWQAWEKVAIVCSNRGKR